MDPVTAISIAQFAISTYSMLSTRGGGDPLDTIVGMLTEINNKLNVISDKLDILYDAVVVLPDRIEYKRRTNDLISVANRMPVIFRNLNSDIKKYGDQRGRREFKNKNEVELTGYLNVLRLSSGLLRTEIDPLTISLLAGACQNDFELCRVLQVDPDYIRNEQLNYLTYFKRALWDDNKSLEKKITTSMVEINNIIDEKFINKISKRMIHSASPNTISRHNRDKIEYFSYSYNFSPLVLNPIEKQIFNRLNSMGYVNLRYFNYKLSGYDTQQIYSIPSNSTLPIIDTLKIFDLYHHGGLVNSNESVFLKYRDKRLKENQLAFEMNRVALIAFCSADVTAQETVKHINNRII